MTERDFYKVLLVGSSGKGKSYSFRNMNPETTGFINSEQKPLPFKNKFKYQKRPDTYQGVLDGIVEYAKESAIDSIVVDSFSAFAELLLAENRRTKKGFDIWNAYNDEIGKFMTYMKYVKKEMFITAHYEILGIEGIQEKRVKVKGREWESMIEKEFTVVLYADSRFDDKGVPTYHLKAAEEGTSAKCPPDLLGAGVFKIENDCNVLFTKIKEFVNN